MNIIASDINDSTGMSTTTSISKHAAGGENAKRVNIFDTNAYRVLTHGMNLEQTRARALEVRACADEIGFSSLAHPIAIWELLTHLRDPGDPAYEYCLHAMVALGEHTTSRETSAGGVCLIADAFSSVCHELFGLLPPGYQQGLESLGTVVTHIVKNAPDLSQPTLRQNIEQLACGMENREKEWLGGMEGILDRFSPGVAKAIFGGGSDSEALRKVRTYFDSPAFFEAWSHYIVVSNAAEVGITALQPDELRAKGAIVRQLFPVAFHLMRVLLKKLATPQPPNLASPKHKRWNFVWDSMIAFTIGPGTVDDAEVFLVTGDGEISQAAVAAGYGNRVISLETYLQMIGIA